MTSQRIGSFRGALLTATMVAAAFAAPVSAQSTKPGMGAIPYSGGTTFRVWAPNATAVTVESFEETDRSARIQATIHVEKLGQKKILVGERGSMLKTIGTEARLKIAELLGKPVHLELFVRETPNWRDRPTMLDEIGIEEPAREDRRS